MNAYFKLTLVAVCFALMAGRLEAGVISLLAAKNTANDEIQDDSHGFLIDPTGTKSAVGKDDIAFGIAKVTAVNEDASVLGRAYVVYSAQISDIQNGVVSHAVTTQTGYTLQDLLGTSTGFGNSIAVLLEWNESATDPNPFADTAKYPFQGTGGDFASTVTPSVMKQDLLTLAANSTVLFGVGISGSDDQFQIGLNQFDLTGNHNVEGRFSITYYGALNPNDFKKLFNKPQFFAFADPALKQEFASYDLNSGRNFIRTNDGGNYFVNYVPEPASMIGLVSLGLAGAGLGLTRRRKS